MEMEQNENPISKAIKTKLRLVDDEVEEAWRWNRGAIYAELDLYFVVAGGITHKHNRAQIESFAAITATLVKRKAKSMIAKALEDLSNVGADENLQVNVKNFILTFFDYSAYAQRLPVFVDEVERKFSSWKEDYNPEELGLTEIEDLFQSYVKDALRTAREMIDAEFTLLRRQTMLKRLEVREEADRPISNGLSEQTEGPKEKRNYFRKDEDSWTISYEGKVITGVKDAKGLHYIAYLLQNPNKIIGVSELVTIVDKPLQDQRAKEFDIVDEETQDKLHIRRTSNLGDSGEVLDQQALQAYKTRLEAIDEDLSEQGLTDETRDKLQEEKEKIEDEIKNAYFHGRPRKGGDVSERIRKAVTSRIQTSIKKITEKNPLLGKHLSDTIKTGSSCSYNPPIFIPWNTKL